MQIQYQDFTALAAYFSEEELDAQVSSSDRLRLITDLACKCGLRLASEPTCGVIQSLLQLNELASLSPQMVKQSYDVIHKKVLEACATARRQDSLRTTAVPWVPTLPQEPSELPPELLQHAFNGVPPMQNAQLLLKVQALQPYTILRNTDRRLKHESFGQACTSIVPFSSGARGRAPLQLQTCTQAHLQQVDFQNNPVQQMGQMMVQMMSMQQKMVEAVQGLAASITGAQNTHVAGAASSPSCARQPKRLLDCLLDAEGASSAEGQKQGQQGQPEQQQEKKKEEGEEEVPQQQPQQQPPQQQPHGKTKKTAPSPMDLVQALLTKGKGANGQAPPQGKAKAKAKAKAAGKAKAKGKPKAKANPKAKGKAVVRSGGCCKCRYRQKGCFKSCYVQRGHHVLITFTASSFILGLLYRLCSVTGNTPRVRATQALIQVSRCRSACCERRG